MNQLVYEHEGRRVIVPLEGKPVSIGRSPEADHQLPTKGASRIHAQVFKRDGAWMVEDLGSSNGTFINLVKIAGPSALNPGDIVGIADMRLTFEGQAPPPPPVPEQQLARLICTPAPGQPPVETMIRDKVSIGRKPGNTLIIDHKAVSSQHCEIEKRDGGYFVRDLGSSNGTYVGEQQVTEHALRNGDVLVIGKAIKVYFIDPAGGAQPGVEAAPPAPAVRTLPQPFVVYEPVSALQQVPVGPRALPNVLAGVVVAALFVVAGWLVAGLIEDARNPKLPPADNTPVAAPSDVAFSFEGRVDQQGNPEGWVASFEAPNDAKVELVADTTAPVDGAYCLSVTAHDIGGAVATLDLLTEKERPLDFGRSLQAALHVRGEGVTGAALALSVVDDKDHAQLLACRPLDGVMSTQWSVYPLSVALTEPLPRMGRLRIMISGNFSRLWLDRLEIAAADEEPAITPFTRMAAGAIKAGLTPGNPAELNVSSGGLTARFAPRLLDAENRELSEPELWCTAQTTATGATFRAILPRRGEIRVLDLRAAEQPSPQLADKGLRLSWRLAERAGSNLALQAVLPLPVGAGITLADRRGTPLEVSRSALHAFAYSTISEITVDGTGLSLVFPQGAVAWFDLSRKEELGLTLRAAPESARDMMVIEVYSQPLMHARLYERVYADGMRWMNEGVHNYSAALARFEWLASPQRGQGGLPVIARAHERIKAIEETRASQRGAIDTAWQAALGGRTRAELDACEKLLRQYLNEFSADPICPEYRLNVAQIERWQRESAMVERTPDERRAREAMARSLYEAADAKFKLKNYLIALIMVENIMRDFADSETMRDAKVLYDEIQKLMNDPVVRDKEVDARLADIDMDIKAKRYGLALNMCRDLFKRFPDSPRSREIMQRLRVIESAYE